MLLTELGSSGFAAATDLQLGDLIIVANTVKRITSDPFVFCGYVVADVENVGRPGTGRWQIRADVEVPVLQPL